MADLELNIKTQHTRDNSSSELLRLGERFRHLARNLSEVFISASRQGIVHRIETDVQEEETRERLWFFEGLKKRYLKRKQKKNYVKPQLITVDGKPVEPKPAQSITAKPSLEVRPASSLLEAARSFSGNLTRQETKPLEPTPAAAKPAAQLKPSEVAKYNNYADLAEQFLSSKQIPHFRTLYEKAQAELSPEAVALLKDLAERYGFVGLFKS